MKKEKLLELEIEEVVVSFETAKLSKEKGFSHHMIMNYYNENKELIDVGQLWTKDETEEDVLMAPTQCMLQRWLRQEHGISVLVGHDGMWTVSISKWGEKSQVFEGQGYDRGFHIISYEQALESGLEKGLLLIK